MPAKKATAAASERSAASETSAAPASQPAKKAAPAKAAAKAPAKAARAKAPAEEQPVRSTAAPVEPEPVAAADADDTGDTEVPLNRAERRAKGRGKNPPQIFGARGKVSGGHGPAHTQRNWANRRSG